MRQGTSGVLRTSKPNESSAEKRQYHLADRPRDDLDEPADCIHVYISRAVEYSNANA